jgi:DNA adenine methylase
MPKESLRPFIKWPGGKRWVADRVAELIRFNLSGTYFEPFLGGGAVFFALRPKRAVLADINDELIAMYRAVRDDPEAVISAVRRLRVSANVYYRIRAAKPSEAVAGAARFLYLNKTAFSGIYRLNLKGEFNVPYGGGERTPEMLWKTDVLRYASKALRQVHLKVGDFEPVIDSADEGDVVYCDPTYTVAHDNNGFVRYNERNFSWSDQERLARCALRAVGRGVTVVVSNAHHTSIKKLYRGANFETLSRVSRVTPHPDLRRTIQEFLIVLKPRGHDGATRPNHPAIVR